MHELNLSDAIRQNFEDSIQTRLMASDMLTDSIAAAATMITQACMGGKKVLACGTGQASLIAQQFCTTLLDCYQNPRPALPAIALGADACSNSAITHSNCHYAEQAFARSLSALGQYGDILLVVSFQGDDSGIVQTIQTAQERELRILALTGCDGGEAARMLRTQDIEIRVPSDHLPRIQETLCLVVQCLCEAIDRQLMGQG